MGFNNIPNNFTIIVPINHLSIFLLNTYLEMFSDLFHEFCFCFFQHGYYFYKSKKCLLNIGKSDQTDIDQFVTRHLPYIRYPIII